MLKFTQLTFIELDFSQYSIRPSSATFICVRYIIVSKNHPRISSKKYLMPFIHQFYYFFHNRLLFVVEYIVDRVKSSERILIEVPVNESLLSGGLMREPGSGEV